MSIPQLVHVKHSPKKVCEIPISLGIPCLVCNFYPEGQKLEVPESISLQNSPEHCVSTANTSDGWLGLLQGPWGRCTDPKTEHPAASLHHP